MWTSSCPFFPVCHSAPDPTSSASAVILKSAHVSPSPPPFFLMDFIISCLNSNSSLLSGFPDSTLVFLVSYAFSMSHAMATDLGKTVFFIPYSFSLLVPPFSLKLLGRDFKDLDDWTPRQQRSSEWPLRSDPPLSHRSHLRKSLNLCKQHCPHLPKRLSKYGTGLLGRLN